MTCKQGESHGIGRANSRVTHRSSIFALERKADFKSEYDGGFITAMAGASDQHNAISVNMSREISVQFKNRPCRVYASDMRLCVNKTGLYTYPDVMAVCGERQFLDDKTDTLLNPTLVVEVLSDSTESMTVAGNLTSTDSWNRYTNT